MSVGWMTSRRTYWEIRLLYLRKFNCEKDKRQTQLKGERQAVRRFDGESVRMEAGSELCVIMPSGCIQNLMAVFLLLKGFIDKITSLNSGSPVFSYFIS